MATVMESVDLPERINEEILACKICFMRYHAHNMPKMLTCSHTFCHDCIMSYLKSKRVKNKMKFPCPLCRKETIINGPDGVRALANNYTVLELLDMVEQSSETLEMDSQPSASHGLQQSHPSTDIDVSQLINDDKCCCCGRRNGVIPVKCEHKVCETCEKDHRMEVIPCRICEAIQSNNMEYYGDENPPPYCEHEDRPPAYNPQYADNPPTGMGFPGMVYQGVSPYQQSHIGPVMHTYTTSPGNYAQDIASQGILSDNLRNMMNIHEGNAGPIYPFSQNMSPLHGNPAPPPYVPLPQRPAPQAPPQGNVPTYTVNRPNIVPSPESIPPQQRVAGAVAVFPVAIQQQQTQQAEQANSPNLQDSTPVTTANARKQPPKVPSKTKSPGNSPSHGDTQNTPSNQAGGTCTSTSQGQVPVAAAAKSVPKVPPRRLVGEPQGLPFKCVKKFGGYSKSKMQSGTFQKPTRVSANDIGGAVVVTDTQQMAVQIFTAEGDYVYMFKVLGVTGACVFAQDRLAVTTHRGVEIYNTTGHSEAEMNIGPVINTVPYKFGFIAVKQKSLVFFSANLNQTKELTKKKLKTGGFKKSSAFENIKDVGVSMSKEIVVVDGGDMFVMDDDGVIKIHIQPHNEPCGRLTDPFAVTFDRWSNIFVSDLQSRKVFRFSPNGKFSRCVLNFGLGETSTTVNDLKTYGVSASPTADHLLTVICGQNCAEVRIYKLY